jgi:hypothetical protein
MNIITTTILIFVESKWKESTILNTVPIVEFVTAGTSTIYQIKYKSKPED